MLLIASLSAQMFTMCCSVFKTEFALALQEHVKQRIVGKLGVLSIFFHFVFGEPKAGCFLLLRLHAFPHHDDACGEFRLKR